MSEFVEVKTADLFGAALDWAVAQVENPEGFVMRDATDDMGCWIIGIADDANDPQSWLKSSYSPSTDWSQGGPLIDEYMIGFGVYSDAYFAVVGLNERSGAENGPTHLIAACRAIVASVLGETVSVPKELLS